MPKFKIGDRFEKFKTIFVIEEWREYQDETWYSGIKTFGDDGSSEPFWMTESHLETWDEIPNTFEVGKTYGYAIGSYKYLIEHEYEVMGLLKFVALKLNVLGRLVGVAVLDEDEFKFMREV